jgi:hypothetical protein
METHRSVSSGAASMQVSTRCQMSSDHQINELLQRELQRRSLSAVTAVAAAKWLDRAGLLADSKDRPGRGLRELLRGGRIVGARQEMNRRWFIDRVESGS